MSPYGGGKRVRTADPLLAGQVLYQLSYTPKVYASENNFNLAKSSALIKTLIKNIIVLKICQRFY